MIWKPALWCLLCTHLHPHQSHESCCSAWCSMASAMTPAHALISESPLDVYAWRCWSEKLTPALCQQVIMLGICCCCMQRKVCLCCCIAAVHALAACHTCTAPLTRVAGSHECAYICAEGNISCNMDAATRGRHACTVDGG